MFKIGICGNFGNGENVFDGQTVKTHSVADGLKKQLGTQNILCLDSAGGKFKIIRVFVELIKVLCRCENIIMLPAHNALLIFTPVLSLFNKLFKRGLYYVVIGGWLAEYLPKHKLIWKMLEKYDRIFVESELLNQKLKALGFKNTVVLPNFKNLEIISSDKKLPLQKPMAVCTFSRVLFEKGIEDAIEAVTEVNNKYGENACRLDIYGSVDDAFVERFDELQKEFPAYIRYGGCIDADRSSTVLREYNALLFPTHYTAQEGFPGTMLDAFASATPVIAYDWDNNNDIVVDEENGLLCDERNAVSLQIAIERIMNDNELYKKLVEGASESAIKYSPEKITEQLLDEMNLKG